MPLTQTDEGGVGHPVCFASWSCNAAEQNYSSFEGECLAVVWATSHFRSYLFGNSFTLVTDHEPLKWIMTTTKLTGKLARWSLLLQEYDFTVEHRAGGDNTNADCLSRYPRIGRLHVVNEVLSVNAISNKCPYTSHSQRIQIGVR